MNYFHETMSDLSFPSYEVKDVELKTLLGAGYTGEVYSGNVTIHDDTIDCVIKKLCRSTYGESITNERLYQDAIDEIRIGHRFMSQSKHQIQFYGYALSTEGGEVIIYLLMEKHVKLLMLLLFWGNRKKHLIVVFGEMLSFWAKKHSKKKRFGKSNRFLWRYERLRVDSFVGNSLTIRFKNRYIY